MNATIGILHFSHNFFIKKITYSVDPRTNWPLEKSAFGKKNVTYIRRFDNRIFSVKTEFVVIDAFLRIVWNKLTII